MADAEAETDAAPNAVPTAAPFALAPSLDRPQLSTVGHGRNGGYRLMVDHAGTEADVAAATLRDALPYRLVTRSEECAVRQICDYGGFYARLKRLEKALLIPEDKAHLVGQRMCRVGDFAVVPAGKRLQRICAVSCKILGDQDLDDQDSDDQDSGDQDMDDQDLGDQDLDDEECLKTRQPLNT